MCEQDGLADVPLRRSQECEGSTIDWLSKIVEYSLMAPRIPFGVMGILRGLGIWVGAAFFVASTATFASEDGADLANSFVQHVKPFLDQHCERCYHPDLQSFNLAIPR